MILTCGRCGWSTRPAQSKKQAAYWLGMHSCEYQLSVQAMRNRQALERIERQAVPPTACPHGGIHKHGSATTYRHDGCKCPACRDANSAKNASYRRRRAYGQLVQYAPTAPVLERINQIKQETGIGWKKIADQAGVSRRTVSRLLYFNTRWLRLDNYNSLMAVQPEYDDGHRIDGTGTRRRLQALIALGWTRRELSRQLGRYDTAVSLYLREGTVTARVHRQVRDLYEQMCMTLPQPGNRGETAAYAKARSEARRNGWPPPLAWDDEQIDKPDGKPHGSRVLGGHPGDLYEPVRFYHRQGYADTEICRLVMRTPRTVKRIRMKLGLHPNPAREKEAA